MTTTWFTSDLHLGHPRVAELRGFDSVEEHDASVLSGWFVVKPNDIVWVLGDIAVHKPAVALDVMAGLPGRKRLVAGNHDPVHPMHRDAHKWTDRFNAVFEVVLPFAHTRIRGLDLLLSHFPYTRDRGETRFAQYRLPNYGLPLLHGHVHDTSRLIGSELHVGLDAWNLGLVPEWQVLDLLT